MDRRRPDAGSAARLRRRQGEARIRGGVPYADRETTLSLLPLAAIGEWLADRSSYFGGRLLDVGCGNQPYAAWHRPLVDTVVAADVAPVASLDAVAAAGRLPFRSGCFDTVLSTQVLEHVEDPQRAVAEAHRVLRPHGHLIVTVPFLYPVHEEPYDFQRFTHYGLRSMLEDAGFEVVHLDAEGGPALLFAHLAVLATVQAIDGIGRTLGLKRRLTERRLVRAALWVPQELGISARRRLRRGSSPRRGVRRLATRMSLGYFAVARRQDA